MGCVLPLYCGRFECKFSLSSTHIHLTLDVTLSCQNFLARIYENIGRSKTMTSMAMKYDGEKEDEELLMSHVSFEFRLLF